MFFNRSDLKIAFMVMPDVQNEFSKDVDSNEPSNPSEESETEDHADKECLFCW